jgi:hypothetical protein
MGRFKEVKKEEVMEKLPARPPCAPKGIDLGEIIELRKKGLSFEDIGKVLGCAGESVRYRFRRVEKEINEVARYKQYRSDILAIHQKRILDGITDADIKKSSLKDKTIAFGVLFDKEKAQEAKGPAGGIKIEIINYAGASQTGEGKVAQIINVTPQGRIEDNEDDVDEGSVQLSA